MTRRSALRGTARTLLGLLGLGLLALAYDLFVPPPESEYRIQRPVIARLARSDNAWTEYTLAIEDLASEERPRWLREFFEQPGLGAEQRAYLDRHAAVITHLEAGARQERTQLYAELPTARSAIADMSAIRAVSQVAAAEARRRRLSGHAEPALALERAAYRYGTALAQPDVGLLPPLLAAGCRRTAITGMFESLQAREAPAAAYIALARQVAADDALMPDPLAAVTSEWGLVQRGVEDAFLLEHGVLQPPAGYRARVFRSFRLQHDRVLEAYTPSVRSWNMQAVATLDQELLSELRRAGRRERPLLPSQLAAGILQRSVGALSQPLRLLYVDRANGAALQALAVCLAYERARGRFPQSLAEAFVHAALAVPRDPASGLPPAYRLDAGQPVVWLAGLDGQDDGGRLAYADGLHARILPGTDLVYRIDERPAVLRRLQPTPDAVPPAEAN